MPSLSARVAFQHRSFVSTSVAFQMSHALALHYAHPRTVFKLPNPLRRRDCNLTTSCKERLIDLRRVRYLLPAHSSVVHVSFQLANERADAVFAATPLDLAWAFDGPNRVLLKHLRGQRAGASAFVP